MPGPSPLRKSERNRRIREEVAKGRTYQEVGDDFGISRQRVDQIIKPRRNVVRRKTHEKIVAGKLRRPRRCPKCNRRVMVHAHHPDYSQPDLIEWRCSKCHGEEHRGETKRTPAKRLPLPVQCPECGAVRMLKPSVAAVRLYCSVRCSGRAQRLSRKEVDRRLRETAERLRSFVHQHGYVPTSGDFARSFMANVGTSATSLIAGSIDPGSKRFGSASTVIDRVYLVAGFRRPDGRSEPNGYPVPTHESTESAA